MEKLQLPGRLGTPMPPLQTFLTLPSSMRMTPFSSCGSASVSTSTNRGDRFSAGSATASAASSSSNESLCSTGGWVLPQGMSRYRFAISERVVPRAASLLEKEASVLMEPTTSTKVSESTRQRKNFEAEVKAGRVECTSRGCRPIFDNHTSNDSNCCVLPVEDGVWADEEAFSLLEARAASYTERRTVRDLEICPDVSFPVDFAEFVNDVWKEKSTAAKYFEIAMKRSPNDANMLVRYAQFAWKTLGDLDKADELFARAVEMSHENSELQSMYALFLWQMDV
ncbi:unnamed protein product [Calypogeia fissa]